MKNFGFLKVAAAVPTVAVADCSTNAERIERLMQRAEEAGVAVTVFPELSLTGYTCADLFAQTTLLAAAEKALEHLVDASVEMRGAFVVGLPVEVRGVLFNCAAVISRGEIVGVVPKQNLPNHGAFGEGRWFASGVSMEFDYCTLCGREVPFANELIFTADDLRFGVEIGEDLWSVVPSSSRMALSGAELILNPAACPEEAEKYQYLRALVAQQSARAMTAYVYASAGYGESTTDLVFGGNAIIAENGDVLGEGKRFAIEDQLVICDVDIDRLRTERRRSTTFANEAMMMSPISDVAISLPEGDVKSRFDRVVDPSPFVPTDEQRREARCAEIFSIQTMGLAKRLQHTHSKRAIIGISGGLDSTLALIVTVATFDRLGLDRKGIIGVTMPGFGTTGRTYNNALRMMEALGITVREISIVKACRQHFEDLGLPETDRSVTYENSQARERTQLLMDLANMENALVVGTGDLSELALGWATYNGDHMSMYGVNGGVPKTLVRHLVGWFASQPENETVAATLRDVMATPISPELLPADEQGNIAQKTEDLVGPYELHDFFLHSFMRCGYAPDKIEFLAQKAFEKVYDAQTIKHWLATFVRRFFSQQFKRSALPDGPKVGSVSLSPRGDWRMPSDAVAAEWQAKIK